MSAEPQFFDQPGGFVGQPLVRVEGREKVTGRAKYSAEFPLPGLTYGVLATSTVAKGKIQRIDTSAAAREPGVIAVLTHQNLPKLAKTPNDAAGKKDIGARWVFCPLPAMRFSTPRSQWRLWWPTPSTMRCTPPRSCK
ncbi:hypothetical protein [Hymenobacter sp. BRD67]|uniref:hypothetical protein n=1 Tax=Hymenobacter sp. BRD67 TaxID=2675877 RepID=UPI001C26C858|nr:hypothetical protein [Hymenobacter sp. BRD67]